MTLALLRWLLLFSATAYVAICAYMYLQQRSLQYFPSRAGLSPGDAGLEGVAAETLATPDGEKIVAWYAPAGPARPTILFFHGNGGEVSGRAERLAYYQSQGYGALLVSYRGYGGSSGQISEQGFITDALTAYDWLLARGIPAENIGLVGESLGTGVAVQLAAQRKVAALALEAPYTSAADVAAEIYWWLPVNLLMKDTFHSRDFIGKVQVPLLIQHGDADGIIPVTHGKRLFGMASEPKQLVIIPGAGHDVISSPDVWAREIAFFDTHIKAQ